MPSRSPRLVALASRALLAATLGTGTLACHAPSTKLPLDPKPATTDEDAEPGGEASTKLDPLPVEAAADLLPAETMVLFELSDPGEFLGLLAPLDQIPEFSMVRSEARAQLGVDPFDAAGWREAGLDPDGPVGIGLLEIESQSGFAYAKLSDPQKFEAFLDKAMGAMSRGESLPGSVEVGQGRMIRINDDLSLIIREGYVVGVLSDRPERARRDYAATVATLDPREALSREPGFAWVGERRKDEDDGLMFVAPQALIAEVEREIGSSSDDYGIRHAREALEQARRSGESVDVIRELEQRLEEERRWQQRRAAEQQAALELVRRVFGSMGAAFVSGDLRDDGVVLHGATLIQGASVFRDLFVPVSAESPLMRALDEPLLAGVDGHANVDAMLELVDLAARADGESLAELNAEVQTELGVNLLSEFFPALDGRGGFMLTEAKSFDPKKLDPKELDEIGQSLGIAAYLGLGDPQAIEDLFDRLVRDKRFKDVLRRAKRGPGWTLDIPNWREVELRVVGDQLIASTDTGLAARVEKAKPGKQADVLTAAEHPMRGSAATPALRMYQRWRWVALTAAHSPWPEAMESTVGDMDSSHSQLTPEEAAKVPKSKAYKKKYKELEKIIDEINEFNLERAREEFELALQVTESLGEFGMQVEPVSDGLALQARWQMAQGANPVELGARMMMMGGKTDWDEYNRLMSRRYELRDELWNTRQADLDAAAAKRNK